MNFAIPEGIDPSKINVTRKDREFVMKYEEKKETNGNVSSVYFYKQVVLPKNTDLNGLKYSYGNNNVSIKAPLNTDFKQRHVNNTFF